MTRRESAARRRERLADLELLRDAVALHGGRIYATDRRIRRLVRLGWATHPDYAYGAARSATAQITPPGRAAVEDA